MLTQDRTAEKYEETYTAKYQKASGIEKKLLKKLLTQNYNLQSVLEVGCGTAHFTRWMETLGLEAYGADVSPLMLKEAKFRWHPNRLIQCEAAHLPFSAKSFDAVAFITSLEFIPDAHGALAEAARVAKKAIIIGLLNKNSLSTLKKRLQAKTEKDSFYQNAHFYSKEDIEHFLKTAEIPYKAITWRSTLFPAVFANAESSTVPFGAFLGVAITLRDSA